MMDYSLPAPESVVEIGHRAKRLRELLGMTLEQVAARAFVAREEVLALESGGGVRLDAALAIHDVLSVNGVGANLFTRPRLRSIDEVEAFEHRRLRR
ncbi:helix-turn-helix transcriptional regulator [Sphingomonas sp. T9W2]|uniref:helix-turn-helix transcriptional regulator n=1 Tax=Sphingomonas sp. T9W2 TaxID=3143183 RepID=UPI0031F599D9